VDFVDVVITTPCFGNDSSVIPSQDPRIHLSESDFWDLTENGKLCNAAGEIGPKEFENIMRRKIHTFVQTRLTDFSDCRTAADIELTTIGALKTIVSEVLLMAHEQRKSQGEILRALVQLQKNSSSCIHDSASESAIVHSVQTADVSNNHSGTLDSGSVQSSILGQSSLSVPKLKTKATPYTLATEEAGDSNSTSLNEAVNISVFPDLMQVTSPGLWPGACTKQPVFQERDDPGNDSIIVTVPNWGDAENSALVLGCCGGRDSARDYPSQPPSPSIIRMFSKDHESSTTQLTQRQPIISRINYLPCTSHIQGQMQGQRNADNLCCVDCKSEILSMKEVSHDLESSCHEELTVRKRSKSVTDSDVDPVENFRNFNQVQVSIMDGFQLHHASGSIINPEAIDNMQNLNHAILPELQPEQSSAPLDIVHCPLLS
jgi:hypothetical protein